ncbi:peptidase S8/S53 domain-containing protein [Mucor mucedo]|uniref:peptidase S8/S53 domain-containing protein n=1 Tax=Mucor mucedo TaxID=29922 RepID=UPI00221EB49D|nr:peptidase S8/S53 domain-containing protein [Mucor mucedo]KAI7889523.1 peptidase S8/S53 domain-containing protein [Mucor mucedo]
MTYLSSLDDIEYIEPNNVYKAAILPSVAQPKPYSPREIKPAVQRRKSSFSKRNIFTQVNVPSWGIARINRRDHYDLSSYTSDDLAGNGIHVYVFDTGIDVNHPDFGGRASMEVSFIDYEDDIDHAGHGTHVAGTIGGNSYGVAKNTFLHGVKILDRNGDGSTASLIQDHGIPVFVSAGNSGDDACSYSPAANPDVFAVGASNQDDVVPDFSSYGECVRLYAPGTDITSAWLGDKTHTMDGTSMANPHVTGIAAMLMSEYEFHSPSEVYEALMSIATHNSLTSPKDQGRDALLAYNGADR